MIKLLIIADDFTGALDTGVQFAASGADTLVTTNYQYDFNRGKQPEVLVMDAETRHRKPDAAYEIVLQLVKKANTIGIPHIFKKTDSALRGNIGSELQAVMDGSETNQLPFLPAFPKINRTTKNGIQYIDGKPVGESVFGKDPFEPVTCSYIPDIIRKQSEVEVEVVPSGKTATKDEKRKIIVYDTEEVSCLHKITEKLYRNNGLHIMAGCSGLAAELSKVIEFEGSHPSMPKLEEQLLVVCGSVNPITIEQLDFAEKYGFKRIRFSAEEKLNNRFWDSDEGKKQIHEILETGKYNKLLILDTNDKSDTDDTKQYAAIHNMDIEDMRIRISTSLGYLVRKLIEGGLHSTMLLTGGDTLLGFMNQIKVSELKPLGEIDPGTVLSDFDIEGKHYHVISKSGGFGSEDLLVKIAQMLKEDNEDVNKIYA
jgi:uncharacterized protein YgbK (DUF1537 family)